MANPIEENEDLMDGMEIRRQKQEQRQKNEPMADWEFGKGITRKESDRGDVRRKI